MLSLTAALLGLTGTVTACGATGLIGSGDTANADSSGTTEKSTQAGIYDATRVHEVTVTAAADDITKVLDTYASSKDKEWITATVRIDGQTFEQAGMRLKGNSSLMRTSADADPSTLPWLIKLDKYVAQDIGGFTNFVIRSNNTTTSLNEAVALDLLGHAGLPTSHAVATSFVVNGGDAVLRLLVQDLDGEWEDENFTTAGALFKAESGGDWSFRGTDLSSYDDVFDQETNEKVTDLTPLVELLQFLNQSDDATFAAELPRRIDTAAFARYLAFETLVGNSDDIDGPGNNSFLRWDAGTGSFTIIAWDHNLAFGGMGQMRGGGGRGGQGGVPSGMPSGAPSGGGPGSGGRENPRGGMGARSNILVERFNANADFAGAVADATTELKQTLFTSGLAQRLLDEWAELLHNQATNLVDSATVDSEAVTVSNAFS